MVPKIRGKTFPSQTAIGVPSKQCLSCCAKCGSGGMQAPIGPLQMCMPCSSVGNASAKAGVGETPVILATSSPLSGACLFLTIPNLSKSALAQRPAPCDALFPECLVRASGSTPEVRPPISHGEMFSGLGTLGQLKGEQEKEGWVSAEVYLKRYSSQRHLHFKR